MSTVSHPWSVSFVIHLGLASLIGGYLVTQTQSFEDLIGTRNLSNSEYAAQAASSETRHQTRSKTRGVDGKHDHR